jgi:hypothetical protein
MKKYTEAGTGKKVVEIHDLSFLREKDHHYGWLKRHFLHFSIKLAIRNADRIYVPDTTVAIDMVRYYFVPKEKIVINSTLRSRHRRG